MDALALQGGSWLGMLAALVLLAVLLVVMYLVARFFNRTVLFLDRRIIYTIVALCVLIPLIRPLALPVVPTPEVQGIYGAIDALNAGDSVLIAADFDPASKPELLPILDAAIAHCFIKGLKPTIVTLWPAAPRLVQTSVERQARRFSKVSGTDFAWLGYRPGNSAVVLGVAGGIAKTFATDYYGVPTASMPIYRNVQTLSDFKYIFDIAAGQTVETWIIFGAEPQHVPMGASCTAVSVAQYYAFLQAGQITGLAGGMKGSAEYETLLDNQYSAEHGILVGDATKGMDAQSIVHLFIVFSIVLANIAYFISRRRERTAGRAA
jgi:hypothetical protein